MRTSNLTTLFNKLKEDFKLSQLLKLTARDLNEKAIPTEDAASIRSILDAVPDMPKFLDRYANDLLKTVMKRGDLDIFKVFYEHMNPNFELTFEHYITRRGGRAYYYTYESVLYHAVSEKKSKIAEFLAADERIDISEGYRDDSSKQTPLERAQNLVKYGDSASTVNVLAILSKRSAEIHRKQALELESQAQALNPS